MLTDKVDLLHLLGNRSTVWLSHFCHVTEQEARLDPESVSSTCGTTGVPGSHPVETEGSRCCHILGLP